MAKLKVFRGTKADVDKKAITDGAVLVATDTSTLYVDANGKRLDLTKATTVDSALSSSSTNPVQSKAIVEYVATEINKLETDKLNERLTSVEGKANDNENAIAAINVIAPKTVANAPIVANNRSIAIGDNAKCTSDYSYQLAIGAYSSAKGNSSISVGISAQSDGKKSLSMGQGSTAFGDSSIAIGAYSQSVGGKSTAISESSYCAGKMSQTIGYQSSAYASQSVAIGTGATVNGASEPDLNVMGFNADVMNSVAIGSFSVAEEPNVISVGNNATSITKYGRTHDKSTGKFTETAPFWEKITLNIPENAQHLKRRITNVADPIDGHNAATKNYVDNLVETSKYVHPTTSGNKHIPSGGSSGQILRWSADGTASWGAENDHIYGIATSSTAGLVKSGTDITVDSAGNVSVNNDSHTHGNSTITSVDASKVNSGVLSAERIPGIDASKITSGTISIDRLPAGALERLVTVKDQNAMYALTTSTVQLGDTVKRLDTGTMYIVVDTANLSNAKGYIEYTAGSASSVPWSGVTGKPSTFTPSSHTHTIAQITDISNASVKHATSANSATQDSAGQQINTTYIKGLSVSGRTITYTRGDNTTGTITTQDTNTTYSAITNNFIDTLF